MKWYFCANEDGLFRYEFSIRVAVESAIANTTLDPHVIYDGGDHPILDWMSARGGDHAPASRPYAAGSRYRRSG